MDKTSEKSGIYGCYTHEKEQKLVAASLLFFGYSVFKRASVIKQFAALSSWQSQKSEADFSFKFPDIFYDGLIDAYRIGVCFENYFKAKILLNGFLVHVIDKATNEALFREQKLRPVEVSKLIPAKTANNLPVLNAMLKKQTINYETLLEKEEYTRHLDVDFQILEFLSDLNRKEGRLHFYNFEKGGMGKKTLNSYSKLIQFVDNEITTLQNGLLKNLDAEDKKRLAFI